MPKLSKRSPGKKRRDSAKTPPPSNNDVPPVLPQVWLPVDLSTLQNDTGGDLQFVPGRSVPAPGALQLPPGLGKKGIGHKQDGSVAATFGDSETLQLVADETLTEEERGVANYWALEEREPRGWLEDEELDYTRQQMHANLSSSPTHLPPTHPSSSSPPSIPVGESLDRQKETTLQKQESRTFSYAHSQVYNVKSLGDLRSVSSDWLSSNNQDSVDLVKIVETAQRQGQLPWTPFGDSNRIMMVSRYGIKIMDTKRQRVYCRHALHNIVSVVYYTDPTDNPMLAVRVTKGLRHKFDLFVYQCESETQATAACAMLKEAFEAVLTKLKWEESMGAIELH